MNHVHIVAGIGAISESPFPVISATLSTLIQGSFLFLQECMKDPVVASDGQTYEKYAIENWFKEHDTSPMTNAKVPNKILTPNLLIRSIISNHYNEEDE